MFFGTQFDIDETLAPLDSKPFNTLMNSGELRIAYLTQLRKCKTKEEKEALLAEYDKVRGEVLERELSNKDIMTSY